MTSVLFSDMQIDTNVISCNRLVLLHGPPGTGKTSLCKVDVSFDSVLILLCNQLHALYIYRLLLTSWPYGFPDFRLLSSLKSTAIGTQIFNIAIAFPLQKRLFVSNSQLVFQVFLRKWQASVQAF